MLSKETRIFPAINDLTPFQGPPQSPIVLSPGQVVAKTNSLCWAVSIEDLNDSYKKVVCQYHFHAVSVWSDTPYFDAV